jgi:hypothetical protein
MANILDSSSKYTARFGTPAEWDAFAARHERFLDRLGRLTHSLNATFLRPVEGGGRDDALLFFIGRQSVDDFFEILLMCGNRKHLRSSGPERDDQEPHWGSRCGTGDETPPHLTA